jgi:hypothetical protein
MQEQDYSQKDWAIIHAAPIRIFSFVAHADGKLHDEELQYFRTIWKERLRSRSFSDDETINLFIKSVLEEATTKTTIKPATPVQVRDTLYLFKKTIGKREEAEPLRHAFAKLAQETADAAGAMLGKRTSKEEQRAVDFVIGSL